jgi:type VI secretion system protein ImpA
MKLQDSDELLLAPLSADAPCGVSIRAEQLFTDIRFQREEDDPSLTMGQWERPLKRADWAAIEKLCITAITTRGKDLQIAAWLLEAWLRQSQLDGLRRGLLLISELLSRHWDSVYPPVGEDGDVDARLAPFEWLNASLPVPMKLYVTLLTLPERKPANLNLSDWDKMTLTEIASPGGDERPGKNPAQDSEVIFTRADVIDASHKAAGLQAARALELARACLVALSGLTDVLREKLGSQAPSLNRIKVTLEQFERALVQLLPPVGESTGAPIAESTQQALSEASVDMPSDDLPIAPEPINDLPSVDLPRKTQAFEMGNWTSRAQAYRTLEAVADYLSETEPHSPTPYLIRRAVSWGRMPLPELMAEILREEGDLNRMVTILGLQKKSGE